MDRGWFLGVMDDLSEQESGEAYKDWSVNYKGKQEKDNVAWQTLKLRRMSSARVLKRSYIPLPRDGCKYYQFKISLSLVIDKICKYDQFIFF